MHAFFPAKLGWKMFVLGSGAHSVCIHLQYYEHEANFCTVDDASLGKYKTRKVYYSRFMCNTCGSELNQGASSMMGIPFLVNFHVLLMKVNSGGAVGVFRLITSLL